MSFWARFFLFKWNEHFGLNTAPFFLDASKSYFRIRWSFVLLCSLTLNICLNIYMQKFFLLQKKCGWGRKNNGFELPQTFKGLDGNRSRSIRNCSINHRKITKEPVYPTGQRQWAWHFIEYCPTVVPTLKICPVTNRTCCCPTNRWGFCTSFVRSSAIDCSCCVSRPQLDTPSPRDPKGDRWIGLPVEPWYFHFLSSKKYWMWKNYSCRYICFQFRVCALLVFRRCENGPSIACKDARGGVQGYSVLKGDVLGLKKALGKKFCWCESDIFLDLIFLMRKLLFHVYVTKFFRKYTIWTIYNFSMFCSMELLLFVELICLINFFSVFLFSCSIGSD